MSAPFVVFGAELPWIFPLAQALAARGPVAAIRLGASRSLRRPAPVWPFEDATPLRKEAWTYPPGFHGALKPWFAPAIRRRLRALTGALERQAGTPAKVIVPYPSFLAYVRDVRPADLVYLNYDDYGMGSPVPLEPEMVAAAGTILCSSRFQADKLRETYPAARDRVFHFPHGTHERFLNPHPDAPPAHAEVCVAGALTARYDWPLIDEVTRVLPGVAFTFVGEIAPGRDGLDGWRAVMARVLERPNVRHVRGERHRDTPPYYWRSAANWMPYDHAVPFVRACCPLKLGDGLASGRAVISADVPECRLYPDFIRIHTSAEQACRLIREACGSPIDPDAARRQVSFAAANGWPVRAAALVEIACTS